MDMNGPSLNAQRRDLARLVAELDGRLLVVIGVASGAEARALHYFTAALEARGGVPDFVGGFVAFVSGYLTAAQRGLPDLGLILREEIAQQTDAIEQAGWLAALDTGTAALPIGVDIDTGYGSEAAAVILSCRRAHKQGAQYVQIEDQLTINKSCGHMDGSAGRGKSVASLEEMRRKRLAPALAYARGHRDLLVMARTDALASEGYAEAIARARAYAGDGAHFVFVEAPESESQLAGIARDLDDVPALVVANVVEGSRKTPFKTPRELHELGFDVALYPVGPTLAGHQARESYYRELLGGAEPTGEDRDASAFERFSQAMGRGQFEEWNRFFSF
jgi:2-methylisocitrate lyase-like PEP mutase family enzyme